MNSRIQAAVAGPTGLSRPSRSYIRWISMGSRNRVTIPTKK
jgi:hypothetical protein